MPAITYWSNGNIRRDDELCGVCKGWWENGQLKYERIFPDGDDYGICRSWDENGELRYTDYWVKDEMVTKEVYLAHVPVDATKSIKVTEHKQYEVGVSLMKQDFVSMGQSLGTNVELLFHTHPSEKMKWVIVVNTDTGASVMLEFDQAE